MKKILFTILVIVTAAPVVLAQETVIFSKEGKKSPKKKHIGEDNIVKLAPLSFIGGVIPVYYERAVNDFFAVQAGAGITSRNYLRDILSGSDFYQPEAKNINWSDGTKNSYDAQTSLTDYKNRKATPGYFIAIEPRIYFASEGLEGSFIGISYSNASFNANAKTITNGTPGGSDPTFNGGSFKEKEKVSDVMANFGTQTLYDRISVEYSLGVGLRSLKGERYVYGVNYSTYKYIDGYADMEQTRINFNLSVKVGYHF